MKKTIFFDLGNVLVFFSHKRMCEQIGTLLDVHADFVHKLLFQGSLGEKYELGHISSMDLYHELLSLSPKEIPYPDVIHAAASIFEPNMAIMPLLEKAKAKGNQLVLLSNTCEAHFDYAFDNYPHLKLFDNHVLSYKVGLRKPDPKIFERALVDTKSDVKNCFYTDDLKENVRAAEKMGIRSHLFTSSELLEKELRKEDFI